jgi:hypothetical protein
MNNIPSGRVLVRVSVAYSRKNTVTGEVFVSANVSDTMAAGYERLPMADLVTYAVAKDVWTVLVTEIATRGAKATKGIDKNKESYSKFSPKVVELVIQLTAPMVVKNVGRKGSALSIAGNVSAINVREKRAGNGISLD